MKIHLLTLPVMGSILCSTAQEPQSAPAAAGAKADVRNEDKSLTPRSASNSISLSGGKLVIQTEANGKKETRVIDVNDPAAAVTAKGKVVITTDINGKTETRVVDLKDAGDLTKSLVLGERPLVRTGPVTYLGVATMEVTRELSAQLPLPPDTGLLIGAVAADSPAAKSGLKENDVLSKLDDQILITPRQFAVLIANHKEGDAIKLTYYRKGQPSEATTTLGKHEAPSSVEPEDPKARLIQRLVRDGYKIIPNTNDPWERRLRDVPAEHDVGAEIRKALSRMPPEVREQVEKILRESGALPHGAIPPPAESDPPSPAPKPSRKE